MNSRGKLGGEVEPTVQLINLREALKRREECLKDIYDPRYRRPMDLDTENMRKEIKDVENSLK